MRPDQLQLAPGLVIREDRREDDEDFARLLSMVMVAQMDGELLRDRRERWSQKYWFDRVAELDGTIVGILELNDSGSPGSKMCRIVVDPEFRGQGIGTALFKVIEDHPSYTSGKVFTEVRDNDPKSLEFAERLGFQVKAHAYESIIDPATFEIGPFQSYIDRVRESGLRIASMAELGDTEENRYRLWEIEHITDADIPGVDLDLLPTWEDAKKSWFVAKWYDPASIFAVLDGDKWVGASATAELSPGNDYVQMTCVLREYRGRGIATAVKAVATDYARQRGSRLLRANNHEGNDAMLAISRKFGFQPQPGWFELIKRNPVTTN